MTRYLGSYELRPDGTTAPVDGPGNWDIDHRRIGLDTVGEYRVSTVFLALDHQYGLDGPPLLFETMVFLGDDAGDLYCDRYATKAEAEAGHARVVAALERGVDPGELDGANPS